MSNKIEEKLPIAPTINALEVGQSATFPSERTNAVRTTANLQGLTQHKMFTCALSDDRTVITVTRTA
jgi:hypothetical protein